MKVRKIVIKLLLKLLVLLGGYPKTRVQKLSLKNDANDDIKIRFEKSILRLLKRYEVYDNKTSALQKVTIICSVEDYPIIKLETLIIDK